MPLLAWLIVGDHEDQDRVRTLFLEKNWGSAQATGPAAATTAATTAFSLRKQPLGFIEKNSGVSRLIRFLNRNPPPQSSKFYRRLSSRPTWVVTIARRFTLRRVDNRPDEMSQPIQGIGLLRLVAGPVIDASLCALGDHPER